VNKQDYLAQVQVAVSQLHDCGATWRETVPVHEVFQGKTVWQGDVEVFDLRGHPKAKRAYAWSHLDGDKDERTRFVAVLEIPPVVSAETAVRVQILKDVKSQSKKERMDKWRLRLELGMAKRGGEKAKGGSAAESRRNLGKRRSS
jgi:hypothetical protein